MTEQINELEPNFSELISMIVEKLNKQVKLKTNNETSKF